MQITGQHGSYTLPPEPHARGGQARVFRATTVASGEVVAVKLASAKGEEGAWMDREREELERLHREHPDLAGHIVPILDHGVTDGGFRFIVMPWFPRNLAVWLSGRSLSERLHALSLACDAVCRLHRSAVDVRRGVVHRDIKPNNFLVRGEGAGLEVVVADFGGVKRAHLNTASWNTDRYTEGFAPPDQTLPRKVAPDPSWDAYAMAATVFWGITGNAPASVMEASALLTRDGRKLVRLAQTRNPTPADRADLERLSKQAIGQLVRLSDAEALLEEDVERLSGAVRRMLPESPTKVEGITGELVEILTDYLQPDPTARNPDLRALRSACQRLGRRAVVPAKAAEPVVQATAASLPPPVGETVELGRKRAVQSVVEPVRPAPQPPVGETVAPRPTPAPVAAEPRPAPAPVIGDTIRPRVEPPEPEPKPEPEPEPELDDEVLAAQGASGGGRLLGVVAVGCLGAVLVTGAGVTLFGALSGEEPVPAVAVTPSAPSAGEVREFGGVEFAYIPAGRFTMGSPESEEDRGNDEVQHEVELSRGFWLQTTEVTQGQWLLALGETPAGGKDYSGVSLEGKDFPVVYVSWLDAVRFANALSAKQGLESCYVIDGEDVSWPKGLDCAGYRLPTESEWEYAARAGGTSVYAGTSSTSEMCRYGNVNSPSVKEKFGWSWDAFPCEDGHTTLAPVGSFEANGWGLYDMSGNVWEWCWDVYGEYPTNASVDPLGASTGSDRVARGGSWYSNPAYVRVALRYGITPSGSYDALGLRLARSL